MTPARDSTGPTDSPDETVFTWGAPPLKFGAGAIDELGYDVSRLGVRRVLLVTDAGVAATGVPERAAESMRAAGLEVTTYDGVGVEPTDESLASAVAFARDRGPWDGFVAVGGGSSIDTAKAVNLLTCSGGEVLDYVNAPVGGGRSPDGPLKPLVAVPTTAGTGSESTPVCVLDLLGLRVKSGISSPRLRPVLAVVDPLTTLTLPPEVTAASGMDIVCHALESWTARPYSSYARHAPESRVAYCGANPVSDTWAAKALGLVARSLRRAVENGADLDARSDMMLAATFAGMGFGNAGVHLPHACAYPIAGMVRDYRPSGYVAAHGPLVPHGQAVSLTAPAAFRFTYPADPGRHVAAARLLGPDAAELSDPREQLPTVLVALMRDIGIPNGISGVGYDEDDVPALVEGTMRQQRLLTVAPRDVGPDDVASVLRESLVNW